MVKILGNASKPYSRTVWRGYTFDHRTVSALRWAEEHYLRQDKTRKPWRIGQGSYSTRVDASAGTHDGGGVADIMFAGVSAKDRHATVRWLRRAGFAAWAREGAAWGANNDHCHAVLLGHRTASPAAKAQMASYRAHRDGLAYNGYDTSWRPKKPRRWSHRKNKPIVK